MHNFSDFADTLIEENLQATFLYTVSSTYTGNIYKRNSSWTPNFQGAKAATNLDKHPSLD